MTRYSLKPLAVRISIAVAIFVGAPAAWAQPVDPAALPRLDDAQLQEKLTHLVKDMGDLGLYVVKVEKDGTIVAIAEDPSVCSTMPKATLVSQHVPSKAIARAKSAVTAVNAGLLHGRPIKIRRDNHNCVH